MIIKGIRPEACCVFTGGENKPRARRNEMRVRAAINELGCLSLNSVEKEIYIELVIRER